MQTQQYRNISSLNGVFIQQISSDPNCKKPIDDMDYLLGQIGDTVIELECNSTDVYNNIESLKKGRFITVDCKDNEEAKEL